MATSCGQRYALLVLIAEQQFFRVYVLCESRCKLHVHFYPDVRITVVLAMSLVLMANYFDDIAA